MTLAPLYPKIMLKISFIRSAQGLPLFPYCIAISLQSLTKPLKVVTSGINYQVHLPCVYQQQGCTNGIVKCILLKAIIVKYIIFFTRCLCDAIFIGLKLNYIISLLNLIFNWALLTFNFLYFCLFNGVHIK